MKKLLLSFAVAAMGVLGASAASYEITPGSLTWTAEGTGFTTTTTVDGKTFTLTTVKGASSTALVDPGSNGHIRVYKGSDLIIASSDMEFQNVKLVATAASYIKDGQTVSAGWSYTTTSEGYSLTSETAQKTVTFTAAGAQTRIKTIIVSDDATVTPDPSGATSVASVAATKALATDTKVKIDYTLTVGWVYNSNVFACDAAGDFIQLYGSNTLKVGDVIPAGWECTYKLYNGVTPELVDFTELPAATEGTFTPKEVAASAITVDMVNSVIMVKNVVLSEASPADKANFTGKVGDVELNLRNNYALASVPAGTYDLTLVVTVYQGAPSLYVASYNTEVEPGPVDPDPEVTTVASIAATKALATGTKVKIDYALTVGFVNYNNVFACDAAGDFIQLYGKNTLKVGDVIPGGWEATYKYYNNTTPELDGFGELPAVTEGTFTPKEVAADAITVDLVNHVILVKNVVLAEASPAEKANFTGKVGDTELSLRNNYTLESVPAGTYDLTLVVTVFGGAPSLYVTNYAAAAGIDAVTVDNNAPVEFFNLHGVRVANPENGIYIRRQGATVTKVAF